MWNGRTSRCGCPCGGKPASPTISKKPENLRASVSLRFGYYKFVRIPQAIKTTPTIAAGVIAHRWGLRDLADMAKQGGQEWN
jgi:hypothetical protein